VINSAQEPAPDLRIVSREDALAAGWTPKQLRGPRVGHPYRDTYLLDDPLLTIDDRCRVALSVLPPTAVVSYRTAAQLWRLPLPTYRLPIGLEDLHITVPAPQVVPAVRGIRSHGHDLPAGHLGVVRRIPVTSVPRTLLDLAGTMRPDHLVIVIDAALAGRLTTLGDIDDIAGWAGRRRGVRRLREAAGLAHAGSRSPKETELRVVLVRAGLPWPEPNADVHDEGGGWIATADLLYRTHRIVLEYDGRDHGREERRLADLRRRNLLERAGFFVLAYSAGDLVRPWSIEADVRHAFAVQSGRLGLPDPTRPR
jgi:Protein of unknown function (DUF559)